jgi:hypothetical protein
LSAPEQHGIIEMQVVMEMVMNKLIFALVVVFFLGDPGLQTLAWLGEFHDYIVATAIALISMPWVTEQFDG